MQPSTMRPTMSGKCYDPVFLFMLLAVFLAVGSSFALRAVVSGFGPASAHAAEMSSVDAPVAPAPTVLASHAPAQ